jgi:hypothetical protein
MNQSPAIRRGLKMLRDDNYHSILKEWFTDEHGSILKPHILSTKRDKKLRLKLFSA